MKQNLIIRADANMQIGTGHIMRCIALAQAWHDRGGKVTFLSHCESEALHQRIIDEGFEFVHIARAHPDPSDLKQILTTLKEVQTRDSKLESWVVVDGYHFTPDYEKAIRVNGCRLLVIDDMAHLKHYHADILLNQNIHASSLHYSCDKDTIKLLGCDYALLRREFLTYKDYKREIPDKAKKILVTMGGSDPDNITLKVVKALNSLNYLDIEMKIIAGPANHNISSLEKERHNSPFKVHLLSNMSNMHNLLKWADLAVICAGGTLGECLFMGCPLVSFSVNKVQHTILQFLHKQGIICYIDNLLNLSYRKISKSIQRIMFSPDLRRDMIRNGKKIIDGNGVSKIICLMHG